MNKLRKGKGQVNNKQKLTRKWISWEKEKDKLIIEKIK